MKALVGAFNLEKAFSVIVKTDCETDGSFAALFNMSYLHSLHVGQRVASLGVGAIWVQSAGVDKRS